MAMFTLMRKNEEVLILQIGEDGNIFKLGKKEKKPEGGQRDGSTDWKPEGRFY